MDDSTYGDILRDLIDGRANDNFDFGHGQRTCRTVRLRGPRDESAWPIFHTLCDELGGVSVETMKRLRGKAAGLLGVTSGEVDRMLFADVVEELASISKRTVWSTPMKIREMAFYFGFRKTPGGSRALMRQLKNGTRRWKKVDAKTIQVAVDDLPPKHPESTNRSDNK